MMGLPTPPPVTDYSYYATLLSLILTPATIISASAVVVLWYRAAVRAAAIAARSETDWFVLGVLFGFLGSAPDNFYWMLAWTAQYLGLAAEPWLFEHGPLSNIFFRQMAGIAAALCHCRAALASDSTAFRLIVASCWISGVLFLATVMLVKGAL